MRVLTALFGGLLWVAVALAGKCPAPTTAGNVLAAEQIPSVGCKQRFTGTMANRGSVTLTPGAADQSIPQGYHDGTGKCSGDGDLVPAKVKAGVNLWGIVGTFPSDGTAAAADCKKGLTFYAADATKLTGTADSTGTALAGDCNSGVTFRNSTSWNGTTTGSASAAGTAVAGDVLSGKTFRNSASWNSSVTGSLTNNGSTEYHPTSANLTIAAGYYNGSGQCDIDFNGSDGNVRKYVTLWSAYTGTYIGGRNNSSCQTGNNDCGGSIIMAATAENRTGCYFLCGTIYGATCWGMWDTTWGSCYCYNGSANGSGSTAGVCTD
jgi:hypothetical protein